MRSAPVRRADVHAVRALLYQYTLGPMSADERRARSLPN